MSLINYWSGNAPGGGQNGGGVTAAAVPERNKTSGRLESRTSLEAGVEGRQLHSDLDKNRQLRQQIAKQV